MRRIFTAVLFAILLPLSAVQAQDNTTSETSNGDIIPRAVSAGDVALPDGRRITIHRGIVRQGSIDDQFFLYFHKPIFAFVQNPAPKDGFNKIIWDKIPRDGLVFYQFRMVTSSEKFRVEARNAVLSLDPDLLKRKTDLDAHLLSVRVWPLSIVRFTVRDALDRSVFAKTVVDDLGTSGEEIRVTVSLPAGDADRFEAILNSGGIEFKPEYSYENLKFRFAKSATITTAGISMVIDETLRGQSLRPGDPIFYADAARLKTIIDNEVRQSINATDADMLPLIKFHTISDALFEPRTVKPEDLATNRLTEQFVLYLRAAIKTISDKRTTTEKTTTTEEHNKIRNFNIGGTLFENMTPGINFNNDFKKTLETEYGVVAELTEDDTVMKVHDIRLARVSTDIGEFTLEAVQSVYVRAGKSTDFISGDTAISTSFTSDQIGHAPQLSSLGAFHKGMMICYFGNGIPNGFVLADGNATWPQEAWVPQRLRGNKIPNMANKLLVGAVDEAVVGKEVANEPMAISDASVSSTGFSLLSKNVALLSVGPVAKKQYIDGNSISSGVIFKLQVGPAPAMYADLFSQYNIQEITGLADGTAAVENLTIPRDASMLPPHALCKWILRL